MLLQPLPDGGGLVRRAVVPNHMQIQLGGGTAVDLPKELQKLLGPVPLGDAAEDLARQDAEGGIQTGRTVTLVVIGPPINLPRPERHTLGCVRSSAQICVFSSTDSTMALSGGFRYSPTTSTLIL